MDKIRSISHHSENKSVQPAESGPGWTEADEILHDELIRWLKGLEAIRRKTMFDQSLLVEKLSQIRREDLLRDAEQDRLARLVYARSGHGPVRYSIQRAAQRILVALGRQMVAWGQRLQERYCSVDATLFRLQ